MEPGFPGEKLKEIDQETQRRTAATEYILMLINTNKDDMRANFVPNKTNEQDVPQRMFERTVTLLNFLTEDYIRFSGATLRYLEPGKTDSPHFLTTAGWAEFVPCMPGIDKWPPDKEFPHFLRLTHKGKSTIDGYRAALGLAPLDEARESNRKQWEAALEEPEQRLQEGAIS